MKGPQETNCKTIEMPTEGHANGVLSMISNHYEVEYDEGEDTYVVGEYRGDVK